MLQFTFWSPTDVWFGRGAAEHAGEYCKKYGKKRVLLVTGCGSTERSGLMDTVRASLEAQGIAHTTLGGVVANPTLAKAREGIALALEFGADFVMGVGGGSAIDTAKMIAHGAANPETDVWEFWLGKKKIEKSLGVAALPTLAGAGSELSASSVITNEPERDKRGLNTPFNRPIFALMDPTLLATLPAYQIGCGCADILFHTLERYFTDTQGNHLSDGIAEAVMRITAQYAPKLLADPTDYTAQSEILWAGAVSHNEITGLGGRKKMEIHSMGHRLTADFGIAHGASLTVLFGAWARLFIENDRARFSRFGHTVFGLPEGCTAEEAIDACEAWFKLLGTPTTFGESPEIGILTDERLQQLALAVTDGGRSRFGSFGDIGYEEALAIFRAANR